MKKRLLQSFFFMFLCVFPVQVSAGTQKNLDVFVSIPPQKWLCEQLAGKHITTHLLIPKGQEPHGFEPSPKQIRALSTAKLFFMAGLPFEQEIVRRLDQPGVTIQVVDTSKNIKKIPIDDDGHGHKAEPDPHVWLSPPNLKSMAAVMATAIIAHDLGNEALYKKNLWLLNGLLDDLDLSLTKELAPFKGSSFFVFHPAFGYFANRYQLHQVAVETGGKSPRPKQLSALINKARADDVQVIFVQPQFDPRSAENIANAIGGRVVPLDSLAENVVENMGKMAMEIAEALANRKNNE